MLLGVRRYAGASKDAHGNATTTYGDPFDWEVHGLAPGAMGEPGVLNRDASEVEWTVFAAKSSKVPTERDLVVVDGQDFAVEGRPKDWTRGPWQHPTAGVVVELRRLEG